MLLNTFNFFFFNDKYNFSIHITIHERFGWFFLIKLNIMIKISIK
jgi:hypothetical protein